MSNFVIGPCLNTVIWGIDRMFCHDIRLWQPRSCHVPHRKTWGKKSTGTDLKNLSPYHHQTVGTYGSYWERWPIPWRPNWPDFLIPQFLCCELMLYFDGRRRWKPGSSHCVCSLVWWIWCPDHSQYVPGCPLWRKEYKMITSSDQAINPPSIGNEN